MSILNEAAYVGPPRAGAVIQLDVTTTATLYSIPASFAGQQCRWTFYGDAGSGQVGVLVGDSGVTANYSADSGVSGSTITVSATTSGVILHGQSTAWVMPAITSTTTHFSVDGSTDGKLVIERSTE